VRLLEREDRKRESEEALVLVFQVCGERWMRSRWGRGAYKLGH
jgi:hypothetical protein